MIEATDFIAYVNMALTSYMGYTVIKIMGRIDTLWDAHHEKIKESDEIKSIKEKFEIHEKEFLKFKITTELQNKQIIDHLNKLTADMEHHYGNTRQWYNNVYTLIKGEKP